MSEDRAGTGTSVRRSSRMGGIARWVLLPGAGVLLVSAMPVSELDVAVANLRSAKGMLRVCVTADPANFPSCVDDKDATTRSVPAGERQMRFTLPTGDYAVAVIHDENNNARLDTFAGIPKEGFGFSRNPGLRFGPPRFTAARFTLGDGAEMQQIRMRYIL